MKKIVAQKSEWSVRFIPKVSEHVDVTINGKHWITWNKKDGLKVIEIPFEFHHNAEKIHVLAVGEHKKDAAIEVLCHGKKAQGMTFDGEDGENKDVHCNDAK
jgi:hypothetical protein